MPYPEPVLYPPFNILRAGHIVLTVKDLAKAKDFYTRVIGLIVSDEDADTVYLRGLEEVGHHSVVLKAASSTPCCRRIGLRLLSDAELDKAEAHFRARGLPANWVDVPFQGRTLHVSDPFGIPYELYARMERVERQVLKSVNHEGGAALRFDHLQLLVTDVAAAVGFYTDLGFRTSDYVVSGEGEAENIVGAFMHRKDIPWDLVFFTNSGPRMHHFAYVTPSAESMFRACDAAGLHKYGRSVERGPGRHGMGHVQFTYFRDPDGHRIELILESPHHMLDLENEPVRWDYAKRKETMDWGSPPPRAWFDEASPFEGVECIDIATVPERKTLEDLVGVDPN